MYTQDIPRYPLWSFRGRSFLLLSAISVEVSLRTRKITTDDDVAKRLIRVTVPVADC